MSAREEPVDLTPDEIVLAFQRHVLESLRVPAVVTPIVLILFLVLSRRREELSIWSVVTAAGALVIGVAVMWSTLAHPRRVKLAVFGMSVAAIAGLFWYGPLLGVGLMFVSAIGLAAWLLNGVGTAITYVALAAAFPLGAIGAHFRWFVQPGALGELPATTWIRVGVAAVLFMGAFMLVMRRVRVRHFAVLTASYDAGRALRTGEARFRLAAIVESSPVAIIGTTLDGAITSWNEGAHKTFGYTADEAIGRPIALLCPPDRADEGRDGLARLHRGEVTHVDGVRRRKDGVDIEVAVTTSPVFDATGTPLGASLIAIDVTEHREAQRALAHARDTAEAASRELASFSYSVAHDLRAPLRGVNGFAQVLLDDFGDKLEAEGRGYLDDIRASAHTMAELIDALLSLARVTRSELRRERLDLVHLARTAAAELADRDPDRIVEVIADAAIAVDGDPRLARVLIGNLIDNAWKFTARVAHARIELGVVADSAPAVFFVRDNGAGFDMAHASKLFVPFHRLHTVHEFTGTGIGLATAQRVVQRHGGRIWAEAAVDAGATFYFSLESPSVPTAPTVLDRAPDA